jgi:hypothetical protein
VLSDEVLGRPPRRAHCNVRIAPIEAGEFIARVELVREHRLPFMKFLQRRSDEAMKDGVGGGDAYRSRNLVGADLSRCSGGLQRCLHLFSLLGQ